ncbi:hypothetical protein LNKW23_39050 [Paralimibaculum aggregatum]|uniref:Glycosyltransferase RgtA/B/C/D-like domain-containing protein n=1 Tax=Paralimibaculum aggregatum TaxID=3036245 RepID=A0ABQ6LS25_9RHOB|nr:hypothetical protein [Limibaculum sp. NKW23]GMG84689.1 hypothetical protein LNKW23_39050 [Limibaculum sp. NKW23]
MGRGAGALALFGLTATLWLGAALALGVFAAAPAGDETDYLARGTGFAREGWAALADGYRPPFLPLLIAGLDRLVPAEALAGAARLANILTAAAIPALWWALAPSGPERRMFHLMAAATALWPPFHLLAEAAMAEAPGFFLVNLGLALALRPGPALPRALAAGAAVGLATLAKANAALMLLPLAACLAARAGGGLGRGAGLAAVMALGTGAVLAPWVAFVTAEMGAPRLTTSGAKNLLLGTGHHDFGFGSASAGNGGLPEAWRQRHLPALRQVGDTRTALPGPEAAAMIAAERAAKAAAGGPERQARVRGREALAGRLAAAAWADDPLRQARYGAAKLAHSFGFSLRGPADWLQAGFTLAALGAALALAWLGRAGIPAAVGLSLLAAAAVAFVFLPNIRLKTLLFDAPALLALCALAAAILPARSRAAPP